jgi:hypothetical protein
MRTLLDSSLLPANALLIACSSHEDRCLALFQDKFEWVPHTTLLFHYDDCNPKREVNHNKIVTYLAGRSIVKELTFNESDAVKSFMGENGSQLKSILAEWGDSPVVFDISVFTKRHLLMTLSWIFDSSLDKHLSVVYSEPEDYDAEVDLPLSFGVASLQAVPGFSGLADCSRPLRMVVLLGFEGERALAAYELLQPIHTVALVGDPPYRANWKGRAEKLNAALLERLQPVDIRSIDCVDPEKVAAELTLLLGAPGVLSDYVQVICPLGTKPQALGVFLYTRTATDSPAILYLSPLRHNELFYSHGIGPTWLIYQKTN